MYKCRNCRAEFEEPRVGKDRVADYGWETTENCPCCGVSNMFDEIEEEEEEDA